MSADKETPSAKSKENDAFSKDIAFGVQQTLTCWSTDAIDPPLSKFIQNKLGNPAHRVTDKQVWFGEIIGDSAALFEFVALKKLFRPQIEKLTQGVKYVLNPVFDKLGRKHIKNWANEHHLSKDDPRYIERLEKEKDFQAHNTVDSGIIASAATLSNVGVQKMAGNPKALHVILVSKLAGAVITMGVMLGLRVSLPTTMQKLDNELSDKYFSKLTRRMQKLAGVKPPAVSEEVENDSDQHAPHKRSTAATIAATGGMATLGGALGHFVMDLEPVQRITGEDPHWATKIGGVAAGGLGAVAAAHVLVPESVATLKKELDERYFHKHASHKHVAPTADTIDKRWTESVDAPGEELSAPKRG